MKSKKHLDRAAKDKYDEFYTSLRDVENELRHYKRHFKGKVVYCNCDDPTKSAFVQFFRMKFEQYELKGLIATCYRNQRPDLFTDGDDSHGLVMRYGPNEYTAEEGLILSEPEVDRLNGDGDFRSPECVDLLKEADIVVTNPPFSIIREHIHQIMEHGKKFLILGPNHAATYPDMFPLIAADRMWLGVNNEGKEYQVRNDYAGKVSRVDEHGRKYTKLGNTVWFTNMDHKRRHEDPVMFREYADDPSYYPKYDNYDAIEVSKVADIPEDYYDPMGVPITYLGKHNPDEFEIIGLDRPLMKAKTGKTTCFFLNGRELFSRIVIKRRAF